MKIIRIFIAFVFVSLFVGLGSAFNGQPIQGSLLNEELKQELIEQNEPKESIEQEKKDLEQEVEPKIIEEKIIDNSFSESKKDETSSQSNKSNNSVQKSETSKSTPNTSTNTNPSINNQTTNSQKEIQSNSKQENNEPPKINDSDIMHSITKGRTEHSSDSECYAKGLYIQNKEMDSIMDWNEQHPEEMKQPIINNAVCYPIVKNGIEYWYLHFDTTLGSGMDEKLKELYK